MPETITMAMYGTKHSHAPGVLSAMLANPDVDVVGIYEPDQKRRDELETSEVGPWSNVRWLDSPSDILEDSSIIAVASEGDNAESLAHTEAIVEASKHVFYDKPAGEDLPRFERVLASAKRQDLLVQMGYMFRYNDGFARIAEWARSGFFGNVFSVRAHMSTNVSADSHARLAKHQGAILFDLGGHVLDQVVWLLGRPNKVTSFLRTELSETPGFVDNSTVILEFDSAMAIVDIAAMEPKPAARRFEVYGDAGSAILEPMEPATTLRLCLTEAKGGFPEGVTTVQLEASPRYVAGLAAFVEDIRGLKRPDRSLDHELLVQETLLRATGAIEG
jgi:predicted dehydrogenase